MWRIISLWCLAAFISCFESAEYNLNPSVGLGRRFDGVGAISGGGATSKLLVNYPPEQQSEILDFLFKPNFGASLQILKVEIGGDAQSSEGTEASHMHNSWDENYERGYEWWLMTEAKRRNPDIRLAALAWGYPGWLGGGEWNPFRIPNVTADYITRWIWGAKNHYGLDIDYIGIWNEKPYTSEYVTTLRRTLNERGLGRVKIVGGDSLANANEMVIKEIMHDPELYDAVDIVGFHYPGSYSSKDAQNCAKPLWASEDWSNSPSEEGGGCMARLLNHNYLDGYMTSTIAWNMISSDYDDLQYGSCGMMKAKQPWSGYYEVGPPIWAAAHTTQFVKIGWTYLRHGYGVTALENGGSLVTFVSPDSKDFTVVIETMDTSHGSFCLRAPAVPTKVLPQNVTLVLEGNLVDSNKKVFLHVDVNSTYTLTTVAVGNKGSVAMVPRPKPFPLPYQDSFNGYREHQEPFCFTPQVGSFEIYQSNDPTHDKVLRQTVLAAPIHWCPVVQTTTIGVIGNYNWSDIRLTVDILIPKINATDGVYIGFRVDQASCTAFLAHGLFFFLLEADQQIIIARDLERTDVVFSGSTQVQRGQWYTVSLQYKNNETVASIDNSVVYRGTVTGLPARGFVAFGTDNFGLADFDNLLITAV